MLPAAALLLSAAGLVPAVHAASDAAAVAHNLADRLLHMPAATVTARAVARDTLEEKLLSAINVPSSCSSDLAFITDAPVPDSALSSYLVSATDSCLGNIPTSLYSDVSSYSDVLVSWAYSNIDDVYSLYDCIGTDAIYSLATVYECGTIFSDESDSYTDSESATAGAASASATATATAEATASAASSFSSVTKGSSTSAEVAPTTSSSASNSSSTTSSAAASSTSSTVSGADRLAFGSFATVFFGVLAAAVAL